MANRFAMFFAACALVAGASCAGVEDTGADEPDVIGIPTGETGGMCGGIAGFECLNDGDYCKMAPRECVEIADAAGVCTKKPEVCTMDYRPVCGCDGETYSNACSAASNGVSVASDGPCAPPEE